MPFCKLKSTNQPTDQPVNQPTSLPINKNPFPYTEHNMMKEQGQMTKKGILKLVAFFS